MKGPDFKIIERSAETTPGTRARIKKRYRGNIKRITWYEIEWDALGSMWQYESDYCQQINGFISEMSFPTHRAAAKAVAERLKYLE